MSLSDHIKYLRAANGGLTPWEIAEKSGVPARDIHLLEVKHRRIGDNDEMLKKLAAFFNVSPEDLMCRREAYRKRLTSFLEANQDQSSPIVLKLEGGEELKGSVLWFGREALALNAPEGDPDNPYIVQRGWVSNWRSVDSDAWEVTPA